MKSFNIFALLPCVALLASTASHAGSAATLDTQSAARLDALEKENAALRARVTRLEMSKTKVERRPMSAATDPARVSTLQRQNAEALAAAPNVLVVKGPGPAAGAAERPHFEISGSLLYLQPGAGNLEYGTLVSPLPVPTPNWSNQSLRPDFSPAFGFGLRYMPSQANDIELNWTHLNTSANASVTATPSQMVGPPFEIGPEAALFSIGRGNVTFAYDSVHLDAGHTFCADCDFQLRVFGGAELARIGQTLTGTFQSMDGLTSAANTTTSLFTGAGPRLGVKGQYDLGHFQFLGEMAAAALIGTTQSRIDFATTSPALVGLGITPPNVQSLTSPSATQVVPSIEVRLATAYAFPPTDHGQFRMEVGYQAAAYFNAVNEYSLTQVPTPPIIPPVGVYLATAQHLQSNFTDQGPYMTGSWAF
jgi:hypothetical protein